MKNLSKNEQGFSVVEIVLVIVIIVLIGLVGWLVYKNHHKTTTATTVSVKKATVTTVTKSTSSNSSVTSTQPTDPMAGWLTYNSASSNGNFSFKYPSSGWTITGARNPGYTTVSGSALNGSEYELDIAENKGQGLSTNGNYYTITIGIQSSQSAMGAYYGTTEYSSGVASAPFSNGLQVWQSNDVNVTSTNCPQLFMSNSGNFYKQLATGNFLAYGATFCYGYKGSTSLTYQQQVSSTENAIAKQILSSFSFH